MNVTYLVATHEVRIRDIGTLPARDWKNKCYAAIRIMRDAVGKPATNPARWAIWWLRDVHGLHTKEAVDAFEERLHQLDQPGDQSRLVRCSKCGRVLSDPVSKALGMGEDCRLGGTVNAQRKLAALAAA